MVGQSHLRCNQDAKAAACADPCAEIARAARRATAHMIKARARFYAKRPLSLETLYPGLSGAGATKMIAIATHLLERADRTPPRWFGFGGETVHINARAALLLGRAKRRSRESLVYPDKQRLDAPSDGGTKTAGSCFESHSIARPALEIT